MAKPVNLKTTVGDLHRQRAARHFGIPEESVTPEQRAEGKRLNYFELYRVQTPLKELLK